MVIVDLRGSSRIVCLCVCVCVNDVCIQYNSVVPFALTRLCMILRHDDDYLRRSITYPAWYALE